VTFTPHATWPNRPQPGLPGQPGRPGPLPPEHAPVQATPGAGLAPWLEQRMFEQEMVALSGPLTGELASRVSAQLLTLEALATPRSGRTIQLHVSSPDGTLPAAFAVIDVLDVMKVPVKAVAIGEVGGAALGVYAAAPIRVAYPHARFTLAEPRVDELAGTADEVTRAAGAHLRLLEDLAVRIATATKHTQAQVERDLADRRHLTAAEAVEYGLVDELVNKGDAAR
jgi:ATP-dependent Clp protease, protease subunit